MFKGSIIVVFSVLIFLILGKVVNFDVRGVTGTDVAHAPAFLSTKSIWVDSVLNNLSLEEKIGQLIMVTNKERNGYEAVNTLADDVKKYNLGGILFSKTNPHNYARLYNKFQNAAKVPLLVSVDSEFSVDSVIKFPQQLTLGAIKSEELICSLGQELGFRYKEFGVNFNFYTLTKNKSFYLTDDDLLYDYKTDNLLRNENFVMNEIQKNKIIPVLKHMPSYLEKWDTVGHRNSKYDFSELSYYQSFIHNGLGAIMTDFVHNPDWDAKEKFQLLLSYNRTQRLFKDTLGFNGLIITNARFDRKTINKNKTYRNELKILLSDNDIFLVQDAIDETIETIKEAVKTGLITENQIHNKCKKVLMAKSWSCDEAHKQISANVIKKRLNGEKSCLLNRQLYENAITILKNDNNLIPFPGLDTLRFASVAIGAINNNTFQKSLQLYTDIATFALPKNAHKTDFEALDDTLKNYNVVIVSIHGPTNKYEITQETIDFIAQWADKTNVVIDLFCNPLALSQINDLEKCRAVVVSYEDNETSRDISAQIIFGGIGASGILPLSVSEKYRAGTGIQTNKVRLKYSLPYEVNMDSRTLSVIDSIANEAITAHATPGCQVLAVRNGVVFFNKAYGHHTYDKATPVRTTDIYDIASITKVAATLPALMKLTDEETFKPKNKLSKYIEALDTTNKKDILCKEVLTHYAQLAGWLPFYMYSYSNKKNKTLNPKYYSTCKSEEFSLQVADEMYISPKFRDTIFTIIYNSNLKKRQEYKYSDIGFMLLQQAVENITQTTLDDYVMKYFYAPLGAQTLCYNPLTRFDKSVIVPTEDDTQFRHQLIHGFVHDAGAALMGGVGGHAGVFSNANDLAKLMQMYLQGGQYGGRQYISKETLDEYTERPYKINRNRRALGFDKPLASGSDAVATSRASDKSYGHTGFTGTIAWVDPDYNLVYIFLSNRVHPDIKNQKLQKLDTRTRIHRALYDAMIDEIN